MKNEIRVAAATAVESMLSAIPSLIPVRVGKKDGYALDTGVKDENGKPVYAVVEATVKNTEDTKTSQAFDLDAAITARAENDSKPKKEVKVKDADPEVVAKRAAHKERERITEEWCMVNLTSEPLTASDIKTAIPELTKVTVMQVGTYLKNIAERNGNIKRELVKGKPQYSKA